MSLSDLTTIAFGICFVIGVLCYHRITSRPLQWLIAYLGLALLADSVITFIPDSSGQITRMIYCILFPIEYSIYAVLFKRSATGSPVYTHWLQVSILCLFIFSLYKLLAGYSQRSSASDVFLVMSILTLITVLLYFLTISQSGYIIILSQEPLFWIATGLLFYFTGNLIATGFYHRLYARSASLAKNLYYLNYILNIIRCVLVSIAFFVAAKTRRDGR